MALSKTKSDLLIATGSQFMEKIIGYLILMVLTRYMTKETVGDYFLAMALSLLVSLIADLGTNTHLVRTIANKDKPTKNKSGAQSDNPDHPSGERDYGLNELSAVFTLRLGLSIIGYIGLVGFIALTNPRLLEITCLTAFYTLVMGMFYAFSSFLIGHRWLGTRVLVSMCGQILMLLSVGLMVYFHWDLRELLICYVVANCITLALAWLIVRRAFGAIQWKAPMGAIRLIAIASFPLFILGFLQMIQFKIDTIMLGYMQTATGNTPSQEVARYETAYKLFEASRFMARPFLQVFLPITAALVAQGLWLKLRGKIRGLFGLALVGGTVMSVPVLLLADYIIVLMFGEAYQDSIVILRVLFLTTPLMFVNFVAMFLSNATRQERITVWVTVACLIFNVILNTVAIPRYGALGAAWATLASESLMAISLTTIILLYVRHQIRAGRDATPIDDTP